MNETEKLDMQRAYKLELKHIEKINYKRLKELKMI